MPIIHGDIIDYIHNIAIDSDLCEKLSIGCTCHNDLKQLELCTLNTEISVWTLWWMTHKKTSILNSDHKCLCVSHLGNYNLEG